MSPALTFALVIAAAVIVGLANDALGAFAARRYAFSLTRLVIPTLVVYALMGFFARVALSDVREAMTAVGIAAILSATVGYRLVSLFAPPRTNVPPVQIAIGLAVSAVIEIGVALCGATWLIYGVGQAILHRV
jgi:hypothetical protein